MEAFFKDYGLLGIITYVLLRDALPSLMRGFERWLPIKAKRRLIAEQAKFDADALVVQRSQDLQEREVVAQEKIGDNLVIMNERLDGVQLGQQTVMTALVACNQSLSILLDRVKRGSPTNARAKVR